MDVSEFAFVHDYIANNCGFSATTAVFAAEMLWI